VQTQFGWHVIKLNDTRPVKAPEFESVQAELAADMQREVVENRIAELQKKRHDHQSGFDKNRQRCDQRRIPVGAINGRHNQSIPACTRKIS
jgi:parvulin-like peptidyl-prolyl isomerase